MASQKISAMPHATVPLGGTEIVPIVQGGVNKRCTVDEIVARVFQALTAGGWVYFDGTKLATDGLVTRPTGGGIFCNALQAVTSLTIGAGTFTVDGAGNCTATTLTAGNGFTGSGVFTTFAIQSGVVTSAS